MQVFVDRVTGDSVIPTFAPDVLLLQEVRGCSLQKVVKLLNAALPRQEYGLPVNRPERPSFQDGGRRVIHYDTGIIINRKTVGRVRKGNGDWTPAGHFRTSYAWDDRATSERIAVANHQFLLVQRRNANGGLTGAVVPLVSVHLSRPTKVKEHRRTYYKKLWARRIAAKVNSKFDTFKPDYKVIGGDFNSTRCAGTVGGYCPWHPWYSYLRDTKGYKDALFQPDCKSCYTEHMRWNSRQYSLGVDYIFHAGADANLVGKDTAATGDNVYSDHIFRWARLSDSP